MPETKKLVSLACELKRRLDSCLKLQNITYITVSAGNINICVDTATHADANSSC